MFDYKEIKNSNNDIKEVRVFLDARRVGTIMKVEGGWRYVPKGHRASEGGAVYGNIHSVKRSIETEE